LFSVLLAVPSLLPRPREARETVLERVRLPGYRNHPSLASLLLPAGPVADSGEPSRDKELGTPVGRMGRERSWRMGLRGRMVVNSE
jgi:hypothetical protein